MTDKSAPQNTPKRKKVLFVITKSNMGGAQRYVYELSTGLPRELFDVSVALGGTGPLKDKLESFGIPVYPIGALQRDISLTKEIRSFFSLLQIIKEVKPDIVHLNSPKAGGLGGLAGRLLGVKKIVFTGHGWGFNEERPVWQKTLAAVFQWLIIMLSHTTIAVSETTKKQIAHWPLIQKKLRVVHNGVPPIAFLTEHDARARLAEMYPNLQTRSGMWIGINSELHKNKGVDIALEALAPLLLSRKNLTVVVMGAGEEKEHLMQAIEKAGVTDSFALLGYVENARTYLKAYNIFVMPSRTEALPYALIEAGMAELPVVASSVGGIPEIVHDGVSGILVPPINPEALRSAVRNLIDDHVRQTSLALNLGNTVRTTFSIQTMIRETVKIYTH